jgi:hypothetical protein
MATKEELRAWRAKNPDAVKAHNRSSYERNKEKTKAGIARWQRANPHKMKEYRLKQRAKPDFKAKSRCRTLQRKYGITHAEYEALLKAQNGTCALCPRTETSTKYGVLVVDHDHTSGRVRGLLCDPCNHALGILGDNEAGLLKAISYVKSDV